MTRVILAAVAVVMLTGAEAMAQITQPVTFNVFGRANRQPGTYLTASAQIPDGVYSIGIADTMTDADASDPANSFVFWTEISQDGVTWIPWGIREEWRGGTRVNKRTGLTEPNHVKTAWSDTALANGVYVGWRVRAVLDLPVALRVGFDVTVYPPGFGPQ